MRARALSNQKFMNWNISERQAARNLGIGLIGIEEKEKTFICTELLEAPLGNPLSKLVNAVLSQKGIHRCSSCNEFKHYSYRDRVFVDDEKPETLERAKRQITNRNKMLVISGTSGTIFYCNNCAKRKFGLA
jgi:hypothetical protein